MMGISLMGYAHLFPKKNRGKVKAGLRGLLAALGFVRVLLLFFELLFEFGALFRFEVVALLALDFELFFRAQQFDEHLFGTIALLEADANDSQIATVAVAVAGSHDVKKALDGIVGAEKGVRLTARVQIALLAERDHFLNVRTNRLGLGHGRLHAVFFNYGRHQVAQKRAAMAGVASEFVSCIAMAHDEKLSFNEK